MKTEQFTKIVETDDIDEVNKLCAEGWVTLCVKDNKDKNFLYSLGKPFSFTDLIETEEN